MSKLPKVGIVVAPAWQRERLAAWLDEWRIEQILREQETEADGWTAGRRARARARPSGGLPACRDTRVGQIRLLRPDFPSAFRRPLYVALLAQADSMDFTAAPFSSFSQPATPGELLTGRTCAGLRVLCAWNACIINRGILARSWFTDEMLPGELADACMLLAARGSGEAPEQLARRVGPPLVHPADPRHEYVDEESAWVTESGSSPLRIAPRSGTSYDFPVREPFRLPRAAEPRGDYGGPSSCD